MHFRIELKKNEHTPMVLLQKVSRELEKELIPIMKRYGIQKMPVQGCIKRISLSRYEWQDKKTEVDNVFEISLVEHNPYKI